MTFSYHFSKHLKWKPPGNGKNFKRYIINTLLIAFKDKDDYIKKLENRINQMIMKDYCGNCEDAMGQHRDREKCNGCERFICYWCNNDCENGFCCVCSEKFGSCDWCETDHLELVETVVKCIECDFNYTHKNLCSEVCIKECEYICDDCVYCV